MAAKTEVPWASINSFTTTLPSFYNHEIRFATSNRGLVYGIKWRLTTVKNFLRFDEIMDLLVHSTSAHNGITFTNVLSAILSHIFETYTNLFLTLIPVESFGKIVVKRAEDKH